MKRKMSEEVTKSEMLRLREQGYSNTQIAEQLECCYATVLKYIGKGGVRRKSGLDKSTEHNSLVGEGRLSMISRTLQGKCARFILREDEIGIEFPARDCYVSLNWKEYEELIKDALSVYQAMR